MPTKRPQPQSRAPISRRAFAAAAGKGLAALAVAGAHPAAAAAGALREPGRRPARWMVDLDGDGASTLQDDRLLAKAMQTWRGFELTPNSPYDFRADLFGRGRVGFRDLFAYEELKATLRASIPPARPITVAWHYSWYHKRHRKLQTATFKGGNYLSRDPEVERTFNKLKNEFGITVDALSWISPRLDKRPQQNLNRGYLEAKNLPTRHVALLYESTLSLGVGDGRVNLLSTDVRGNLVEDFAIMGSWLRNRVIGGGARIFELDRRPVIFIYASHTWVDSASTEIQFQALDDALETAYNAFAHEYGSRPFVIGEEMLLAPDDEFGEDRRRRSRNFDAIFVYHHAASPLNIIDHGSKLGHGYAKRQQRLFRRTLEATVDIRNRFSEWPLLLVPSLAAGFAKKGLRKLTASRASYANYLYEMATFIEQEYIPESGLQRSFLPAPIYTLGSWNEEFEGHALFPFEKNRSVPRTHHEGFDMALAAKEIFGWNQYAARSIR